MAVFKNYSSSPTPLWLPQLGLKIVTELWKHSVYCEEEFLPNEFVSLHHLTTVNIHCILNGTD